MTEICPLIFEPIFRQKVWGGRSLERLLGKLLPPDVPVGESWECADLEGAVSRVARGPARGRTLHELMEEWGADLLGRAEPVDGRFPLLIKFLDARENLSVQVHPDASAVRRAGGAIRIKNEAWHIVEAAPGAVIYRGLKPGLNVDDVRAAMARRPAEIVECLERVPVRAGQTYYLPSGVPHALGAGVVVAEVQTPSDVTYRLYDWDRARPAGDAGLHVEEGLSCLVGDTDFAPFERRTHVTSLFATITRLVACPSFNIEKVRFIGELEQEIPYVEPVCWIVLDGRGEILYGPGAGSSAGTGMESGAAPGVHGDMPGRLPFSRGDVIIVPAGLKNGRVRTLTDCGWLEVTLPGARGARADVSAGAATMQGRRPDAAARPAGGDCVPLNISMRREREPTDADG